MDYSDNSGFSTLTYTNFSQLLSFSNNTAPLLGASVVFQCLPHTSSLARPSRPRGSRGRQRYLTSQMNLRLREVTQQRVTWLSGTEREIGTILIQTLSPH